MRADPLTCLSPSLLGKEMVVWQRFQVILCHPFGNSNTNVHIIKIIWGSNNCKFLERIFSAITVEVWVSRTRTITKRPLCVFINTLRPRQNGRRFADDTFKRNFLNENVRISINISLKFVPKGPINNNPALVQIMAWRQSGDKPLSEPIMVNLLTHICVTRPQWVNSQDESYTSAVKCSFFLSETTNKNTKAVITATLVTIVLLNWLHICLRP